MRIIFIISLLICTYSVQCENHSINGYIYNSERQNKPVIGAVIKLVNGIDVINCVNTDFNGHYNFFNVAPGKYILEIEYGGFLKHKFSEIIVFDQSLEYNCFLSFNLATSEIPKAIKHYKYFIQCDSLKLSKEYYFVDFSNCHLNEIPNTIKRNELKELYLTNNNITEIPRWLYRRKNLKVLDIRGTRLNEKDVDALKKKIPATLIIYN